MVKLLLISFLSYFVVTNVSYVEKQDVQKYEKVSFGNVSNEDGMLAEPWNDKFAAQNQELVSHTVKIREDVTIRNIFGIERDVDDATSGSGVVIAVDKKSNKTLILTAEHVCSYEFRVGEVIFNGKYVITNRSKKIVTVSGKVVDAEILHMDVETDVCTMVADGIVGTPAELSPLLPPVGGRLYTVGAPVGIWDKGVTNIEEGIFAGIRTEGISIPGRTFYNFLQYSIPIVGGMSGSAVYYRGKIIGLITVGTDSYEHCGWGPGLVPINNIVVKSLKDWLDD